MTNLVLLKNLWTKIRRALIVISLGSCMLLSALFLFFFVVALAGMTSEMEMEGGFMILSEESRIQYLFSLLGSALGIAVFGLLAAWIYEK